MTAQVKPISQEEFQLLNDFISDQFGMNFANSRQDILISRLSRRLEHLGLKNFMDYYIMLQYNPNGELGSLARAITNNETYFFRETHQFEILFGEAIEFLKKGLAIDGQLRILCAGCSSGEEAYTINIFAKENQYKMWGIETNIDAFDLESEHVTAAKLGLYGPSSMRSLNVTQMEKYFNEFEFDKWSIKNAWKSGIRFFQGNILEAETYKTPLLYDVIFCRNVLIYFSEPAFYNAIRCFAHSLRPQGLLFLGHSESLFGLDTSFQAMRFGNSIAYCKGKR
jgi:chemotaxis protein methyltransferase CheR